ncbi:hypothetical protein WGT02_14825 [Rhizobium sp. T1470]|uniref:hypothetical protein n=1 Tax=Rhizobium sp. T1470 TaxID=555320 RepID=UPI001AAFFAEE|nr:hypothetical protein [Rhizobium sp. T1473]MCA0802479.1 protein rep [Rhizobium sp. T1473]
MQIEGGKPGGIAARALAGVSGAATASGRGVKTHNSVLKSNSGWGLDPVAWARRAAATAKLMEQNDRIAKALQRAGEDVIRPGGVTLISAVTNVIETQRVFRAVRFLPVVAARDRRPTVNGLKLFIHEHPSARYFRYAVMTCAEPVPAFGDLRGAIQELSRRISSWAYEVSTPDKKTGKCYDIEVLYRGIEFTRATAAERDAAAAERGQASDLSARYGADTVLYHVHANVLYWPKRNIAKLWPEFLRYTEKFMDAHWRDNGRVEKVEEIVKYCSKPADTLAATDDELVWLYRQTQKLKICQPMGEFRTWMKELKKERKKVVRVHVGRGDGQLMRVKKGKRGGAPDEDDADDDGNVIEDGEAGEDAPDKDFDDAPELSPEKRPRLGDGGPAANIVIGLTLPQWRHTPWAEPMIMVQNYDPLKLSTEDGADIREWQQQAREWWDDAFAPPPEEALRVARMALDVAERYAAWSCDGRMSDDDEDDARAALKEARAEAEDDIREAAEAASYIVHTCSSTVREGQAELPHDISNIIDDPVIEEIAEIFGGKVVRLKPRTPDEDDEIPFESSDDEAKWAHVRANLDQRASEWQALVAAHGLTGARQIDEDRQRVRYAAYLSRQYAAAACRAAA